MAFNLISRPVYLQYLISKLVSKLISDFTIFHKLYVACRKQFQIMTTNKAQYVANSVFTL
jgi:hypothetical protein